MRLGFLAALAVALTGCGVGGLLAGSAGGGGGGGSSRQKPPPPRITVSLPRGDVGANLVAFNVQFADPQIDPSEPGARDPLVRLTPEFSTGGGVFSPMTEAEIASSEGTRALTLSGQHQFVWNSLPDVGGFLGDVTFRFSASYEEIEGLSRKFVAFTGRMRLDNRLAGTVFGAEARADSDVDTFPVDLRPDGDGVLIACLGANIVERVGPTGRVDRVTGLGVPGEIVGMSQAPGVARLPLLVGVDTDAVGNVFTVHDRSLAVTTRGPAPYTFGLTGVGTDATPNTRIVPPRSVATVIGSVRTSATSSRQFGPALTSARGIRLHPSGAVLFLNQGAELLAANPQDPANGASTTITLAGVPIAPGEVMTVAGGGSRTDDGAPALGSSFSDANALAIGPDGEVYVAERAAARVRVVNVTAAPVTVGGATVEPSAVRTVAGTGTPGDAGDGGPAATAMINLPSGLDVSPQRVLFIADAANRRVRAANLGAFDVTFAETTIAPGAIDTAVGGGDGGGVGSKARAIALTVPNAVALDAAGNLLVADSRRVLFVNGGTTTANSYGVTAGAARVALVYDATDRGGILLVEPRAMQAVSPEVVYFTDRSSMRVFNLGGSPRVFGGAVARPGGSAIVAGGSVAGFFGDDGPALGAAFSSPSGIAAEGPFVIYVADTNNDRIRALNTDDARLPGNAHLVHGVLVPPGNVITVAGGAPGPLAADGDGLAARSASLLAPQGVAVSAAGLLFIADTGHHRIRVVNPGPGAATVAGVSIAPGTIATILGDGVAGFTADGPGPWHLDTPTALALDRDLCYFADSGNARIRVLNLSAAAVVVADITVPPGEVRTIVGSGARGNDGDFGLGVEAAIDTPRGFALQTLDNERAALYFTDGPQHVIRMLNLTSDVDLVGSLTQDGGVAVTVPDASIVTLAGGPNDPNFPNAPAFDGDGQEAAAMRFAEPWGIAVTTFGGTPAHFFVADSKNQRIRRFGAPPLVR